MLSLNGNGVIVKMPQIYPNPNMSSTTAWFEHVNILTDSLAMPMTCFTIFLVSFVILMNTKRYSINSCMLASSTIAFIFSSLLFAVGVLNGKYVFIFVLLIIGSGILNELDRF